VEIENGDFAVTMGRQLIFSSYQYELYTALLASADPTLSALAAKAVKEVDYHRDHAAQWVLRLGDGTTESHNRMQAALNQLWPYVEEIFDSAATADITGALPGIAADPASLRPAWSRYVENVITRATLAQPTVNWRSRGGRSGYHTENLGHLLPEMQHLHRSHPGATW
jgi:ring-1,2-phenylacetyl-CoA epoxidase subunit PaaC